MPRTCATILATGLRCGKPASVLDVQRSTSCPVVYICQTCYERDYLEQQPVKPEPPAEPIMGGQYPRAFAKQHKNPRRLWDTSGIGGGK